MKYYILAGEASGDLHGSNLIKALREKDLHADIRFWGGDLMQLAGGELVSHYKNRAFMGFVEVLKNIRTIFKLISYCKADISKFNPDTLIFIDNSGFNLPIAKWAKKNNFKTQYYISPQVWASRSGRVKSIKRDIDHMFVVLPFVKSFYKTFNYDVEFVGHPLLDAIANKKLLEEQKFREKYNLGKNPIIALLPGSRKQEINRMLVVMLSLVQDYPEYVFVIAGAPSQKYEFYKSFITNNRIKFVSNETYNLLSISKAALVTSGTATLETALFKVPQVVCYKGNAISYHIAKRIIKLKFISLVNLIMDKEIVKELIQGDFNTARLKQALHQILNPKRRDELNINYAILKEKLGGAGASEKVADLIYTSLKK